MFDEEKEEAARLNDEERDEEEEEELNEDELRQAERKEFLDELQGEIDELNELAARHDAWNDLALAILCMKEFIYLR